MTDGANNMTNELIFEQGYDIDRAYAEADRHLAGSDAWHYWMDEAARLDKLHRGRKTPFWQERI